ncbi:ZIP family metal transporter [Microbacterium sp. ASV49]|uniref:ZIP family metal transporter n=1 Tax=Microbacterium candidum TaxID=3041922 RepID=A0ABT7N2Z0_9MICO|nr:ZIP family metal transporter [Microbacterium sp. ASV49]MDL9981041.1 ZIP family metal transporter [Microbacterium sp. ASV49]
MPLPTVLLLGFLAGATIVLGMPLARIKAPMPTLRTLLNTIAAGILLFLFWDVLAHAWEPIDVGLAALHEGKGSLGPVFGLGLLFAGGLAVGLLGLTWYEGWMKRRSGEEHLPPRKLALLIAVGIGLHNFAEGLAIGQSAASGELQLALVLVIGFALHNATEGFGIVAPLAADVDENGRRRIPSWAQLLLLALIGGGPTFLGTWVGTFFTSDIVSVIFLTLAAGSILYVVMQMIGMAMKARRPDLLAYGVLIGLLAGFATDAIVTAGGA